MKKRPFTWQTGRFTVWVNGTQNSGLTNFVPESRFVQISSIYQKTTAKAWTRYDRYQRWIWRNGTQISVWNISSGKTGLPFRMFRRCYRKFSGGTTQKVVCYLLSNLIFRKILVNGKQQVISITITWQKLKHTEACRVQHKDFFLLVTASKDFYLVLVQRNLLHFNSTSTK